MQMKGKPKMSGFDVPDIGPRLSGSQATFKEPKSCGMCAKLKKGKL